EALQSEEKRNEEESDQWDRSSRRLERTTDRNSPRSSRDGSQHQDREASQREARPEDAREEIGAEKLLWRGHGSNGAGHERRRPDDQSRAANAVESLAQRFGVSHRLGLSPRPPWGERAGGGGGSCAVHSVQGERRGAGVGGGAERGTAGR